MTPEANHCTTEPRQHFGPNVIAFPLSLSPPDTTESKHLEATTLEKRHRDDLLSVTPPLDLEQVLTLPKKQESRPTISYYASMSERAKARVFEFNNNVPSGATGKETLEKVIFESPYLNYVISPTNCKP